MGRRIDAMSPQHQSIQVSVIAYTLQFTAQMVPL
jgi:hypothetical protein